MELKSVRFERVKVCSLFYVYFVTKFFQRHYLFVHLIPGYLDESCKEGNLQLLQNIHFAFSYFQKIILVFGLFWNSYMMLSGFSMLNHSFRKIRLLHNKFEPVRLSIIHHHLHTKYFMNNP